MEAAPFEICAICSASMNDPRILSCDHSFCLKCLESEILLRESTVCPTCQTGFQIPQGGLKDLKKNEFIERLKSFRQSYTHCDACKEKQAVRFCNDCSLNYCSACLVPHQKIPTSSNHQLLPIAKEEENIAGKYSICEEHSDVINLFCEDCSVVSCAHCLTSKHRKHDSKHISYWCDSVKEVLKQNLKTLEETIANVHYNRKTSEVKICTNELNASKLKRKIMQRGEDVKRAVDSIVAQLIETVNGELKQQQEKAGDVLKELESLEITLNAQIESLKQQLKNLNCENVVGISSHVVEKKKIVPKYSNHLNVTLAYDSNNQTTILSNLIGKPKKFITAPEEPVLRITEEDKPHKTSIIKSVVLKEDEVFICYFDETVVHVFGVGGLNAERCYEFGKTLSVIFDLIAVDDILYVSGRSDDENVPCFLKAIKLDLASSSEPKEILKIPYDGEMFGLKKSYWATILLCSSNKIIHLTENGDVVREVDLLFDVYDVVQLNERHHFVCTLDKEVCILDERGTKMTTYSPFGRLILPTPCTKWNIYLNEFSHGNAPFSGHNLCSTSDCDVIKSTKKIYYNEENGGTFILSDSYKLLAYEL